MVTLLYGSVAKWYCCRFVRLPFGKFADWLLPIGKLPNGKIVMVEWVECEERWVDWVKLKEFVEFVESVQLAE